MTSCFRCAVLLRIRIFVGLRIDRTVAAHQTPIRIKAPHGHLASRPGIRPLARSVPQKTVGSLPCPSVYSVQITWLPRGSTFPRAHGRGVARLHNPVAGHLSKVETGANQNGWMLPSFSPSLQPQPHWKTALSQTLSWHQRARGPA